MMAMLINIACGLVLLGALYRFPALRVWRRLPLQPALRWLPTFLVICSVALFSWIGMLVLLWQPT